MSETEINVIPLFSSPVGVINVTEDCSDLNRISTEWDFEDSPCSMTKDLKVLDSFPREKEILLNHFNRYKNGVLRLEHQEFKLTSSWGTRTSPGGSSKPHKHSNSCFSGVFYFGDVCGGNLEFLSREILPAQLMLNDPVELNVFNSKNFTIHPHKNMLLFFPSYIFHRINENTSTTPRYSLAFNLFASGTFGSGDSKITIPL